MRKGRKAVLYKSPSKSCRQTDNRARKINIVNKGQQLHEYRECSPLLNCHFAGTVFAVGDSDVSTDNIKHQSYDLFTWPLTQCRM